jgi:hypothetical protein
MKKRNDYYKAWTWYPPSTSLVDTGRLNTGDSRDYGPSSVYDTHKVDYWLRGRYHREDGCYHRDTFALFSVAMDKISYNRSLYILLRARLQ